MRTPNLNELYHNSNEFMFVFRIRIFAANFMDIHENIENISARSLNECFHFTIENSFKIVIEVW